MARELSPIPVFPKLGLLTIVKRVRVGKGQPAHGLFSCDCGGSRVAQISHVKSGHITHCGCMRAELLSNRRKTHGMAGTPEHEIWKAMRQRCSNQNNKHFDAYGGRGISVCERWGSFEKFFSDMGPKPTTDHSIDRINNNGDYEPANCRWATRKEQADNKRTSVLITAYGETLTAVEWARVFEVSRSRFLSRKRKGWSDHDILFTPPTPKRDKHGKMVSKH